MLDPYFKIKSCKTNSKIFKPRGRSVELVYHVDCLTKQTSLYEYELEGLVSANLKRCSLTSNCHEYDWIRHQEKINTKNTHAFPNRSRVVFRNTKIKHDDDSNQMTNMQTNIDRKEERV